MAQRRLFEQHLAPGPKAPRPPRGGPSERDLRRLVRRVEYDGREVRITLHPANAAADGEAA